MRLQAPGCAAELVAGVAPAASPGSDAQDLALKIVCAGETRQRQRREPCRKTVKRATPVSTIRVHFSPFPCCGQRLAATPADRPGWLHDACGGRAAARPPSPTST